MFWLFCILIALSACKEEVEIIDEVRAIKTIVIDAQSAEQRIKLSGIVATVDSSGLSFQVGGQVKSVHAV